MADTLTSRIQYHFFLSENEEKAFGVEIDRETGVAVREPRDEYPSWTELEHCKCKHCPLSREQHRYCPAAVSIIDVVEFFCDTLSIKQADVVVETEARRTELKQAPLATTMSSILGIRMATSGCPILDKLRPMVLHHLPFATADETIYRALSMYVLAQYLRRKKGLSADWELTGLSEIYQNINKLNQEFCYRLRNTSKGEATINALIGLDCFAQIIDFSISEKTFDELEKQFEGYLEE